jgi:methionine-rich copper-binding protein CopC/putative copper export protein
MNSTKKRAITFLLIIFASFLSVTPALAHIDVSATSPYDGEVFPKSPASITVSFEGLVDPTQVSSSLRKADGSKLADPKRTTPDGPVSKVEFALPVLADGTYIAGYRANSSDGHVVEGEFSFSVGAAPASKLILKSKQPQAGRTLEVIARIVFDLGAIALIGSIFWMLILFPKAPKEKKEKSEKELKKQLPENPLLYERAPEIVEYYYKALGLISKIAITLMSVGLVLRVSSFLSQRIPGASSKERYELISSKPLWKLLVGLMIVYVIMLVVNTTRVKQESKGTFLAILTFISLYIIGLVSHAAEQPLPLMDAGLWACHVALVSLWVGPIIVFTILKIIPESKFSNEDLMTGLKQFAPLGFFSVLFVSVTGAAQAWVYSGGGIPQGEYLYLVLSKVSLVLLLLPLGLISNRRIAKNKSIIGKSLKYEMVVMFIIIIIAGILATTTPLSS